MSEQESIQTQLDCLRYDFTEQKKYSDEMAARHSEFARDVFKALEALQTVATNTRKQLHNLQGVVSSLQQDVATLEEKFSLMEEVTNVTVSSNETDEGGAERAEMEYRRIQEEYGTEV